MSEDIERKTIGASEMGRDVMKWLKEEGYFPTEMDAYKCAISLGIAKGKRTSFSGGQTSFNIGSFDSDGLVATLIQSLMPTEPGKVYHAAEELAETGFRELLKAKEIGEFRFADLLEASA